MDLILNKIEDQHEHDTEMGSRLLELANDLKVKIADKVEILEYIWGIMSDIQQTNNVMTCVIYFQKPPCKWWLY